MAYGKRKPARAPVRRAVKPVTRRAVRKAVTTVKAKRFRTAVKAVMDKQLETKRISVVIANEATVNGGGLSNALVAADRQGFCQPNVMDELEVIRGTASNERIGDRITPKSIYLTGMVNTNGFDSASNLSFRPFAVRIVVFRNIDDESPPLVLNMKKDDSVNLPIVRPIDGTALNDMLPYSSEFRIIATRTYKLRAPDSDDLSATGLSETRLNTQTSNFPWYRKFAIKVPCPKVLKYEAGVLTNYWFSVGAYILDANGRATNGPPILPADPPNQVRAKLNLRAHMLYKDA